MLMNEALEPICKRPRDGIELIDQEAADGTGGVTTCWVVGVLLSCETTEAVLSGSAAVKVGTGPHSSISPGGDDVGERKGWSEPLSEEKESSPALGLSPRLSSLSSRRRHLFLFFKLRLTQKYQPPNKIRKRPISPPNTDGIDQQDFGE